MSGTSFNKAKLLMKLFESYQLRATPIPDTVVHNDLNRGNILVCENNCLFTDWCEVSIGNPFITFQHLLLLLPSDGDHTEGDHVTLKQPYQQRWLDSFP